MIGLDWNERSASPTHSGKLGTERQQISCRLPSCSRQPPVSSSHEMLHAGSS